MTSPLPRTIVTADPELDDLNSMIRLLLYSNELCIDGLIYASSRYHWAGDGAGTEFLLPDREYSEPQTSWRWAQGERFIDDAVDAYEQVYPNLAVHDSRYPEPERLRSVICTGNISFEGEMDVDSPGSRLIAEALLDDDPQPLHLQVWAGTSTIARALRSIEETHSGGADWDDVRTRVSRKAVITKFASQDATYDDYIRREWPDIRVTDVMAATWGYPIRYVLLPDDRYLIGAEWMRENVTSIGPLGALYRVAGAGRQMVPGDPSDYFHLSGYSRDELTAQGFRVWIDPPPAGEWISEGDTTNMLNLISNGLRGFEHPTFGGWGGRAIRTQDGPDTWALKGAEESSADGSTPPEYTLTRWFRVAQQDFAARMRWSVTPKFEEVNHHPVVDVMTGLDMTASPGQRLELQAEASDPDGDSLLYRWWHYREAGTVRTAAAIENADAAHAVVTVPADAVVGESLHVLLEVTEDADMPLTAYARVVITVV